MKNQDFIHQEIENTPKDEKITIKPEQTIDRKSVV